MFSLQQPKRARLTHRRYAQNRHAYTYLQVEIDALRAELERVTAMHDELLGKALRGGANPNPNNPTLTLALTLTLAITLAPTLTPPYLYPGP